MNTIAKLLRNFFLLPSWLLYLLIRPAMPKRHPWKAIIGVADWCDGALRPCYEISAVCWTWVATLWFIIRRLMPLVLLALVVGCTTIVTPQGERVSYFIPSGQGVINNTGYNLDVFQDCVKLARLMPGQVLQLPPKFHPSLVSVSAYDIDGGYHGANSYTFYGTYNWQIDHVQRPEGNRE